jgi:hypothetical protein
MRKSAWRLSARSLGMPSTWRLARYGSVNSTGWEVTANLLHQTNPLQIRNENRDPTEGRHRSLGLTQNHPLARSRAVISRGTGLFEVFASTPLYRKHLRAKYSSASEFRLKRALKSHPVATARSRLGRPSAKSSAPLCNALRLSKPKWR